MPNENPYLAITEGIWAMLESDAEFVAAVQPGNRVRFTGALHDPIKAEISTADLPEVRVVPTTSAPHISSSSSYRDIITFEIQVSSGDQCLDAGHFALTWILTRIFANAEARLMGYVNRATNPQWYIARVEAGTVQHGVNKSDLDRGIKGWSGLYALQVEIWFKLSDLVS